MKSKDEIGTMKSLTAIYEAFECSAKEMKDYLDKRITILGHCITEQEKIEHLFEERDAYIDGFRVCEWDAFIEACLYFEDKNDQY